MSDARNYFSPTGLPRQETPLFYHGEIVTAIPNRLLHDTRLSLQARFFWLLIKSHYPRPFPGIRRLAALARVSLSTAKRYINELEVTGYLLRVKRPFAKTEYHLYDKPQKVAFEKDFSRVLNFRTQEFGTEVNARISESKAASNACTCFAENNAAA